MAKQFFHEYSNEISNKKILIIGPYPPPLGGVSIHVQRVSNKLRRQNNSVHIYNTAIKHKSKTAALKHLIRVLWQTKPEIVHYHEPVISVQKLAVVTGLKNFLKYKITTIDHNCRLLYKLAKSKRAFFKSLMKKVDDVVVIGNTTDRCYRENGVHDKLKKIRTQNYTIESPFLPPEENNTTEKLSSEVQDFFSTHSPVITANASVPVLTDNQDLYGFDLCIQLVIRLKKEYPNIGILFGICKMETEEHKDYFAKIEREISTLGLTKHFCFPFNQPEFWKIIKESDLFVRPTISDSFGISIQEALFCNVPAIASDVCIRPGKTILFKTGNVEDFIKQVKHTLKTKSRRKSVNKPKNRSNNRSRTSRTNSSI